MVVEDREVHQLQIYSVVQSEKQRRYRLGNAAKVRELTLQAGLAVFAARMLKEEEYRKAVCGKTARTFDEGAVAIQCSTLSRVKD
jgi:hypothetical protein